jgi:putative endonuclease
MMAESGQEKGHFVYIVRCANDALYTGYAGDVQQRVKAHNAGRGGRYTRSHLPVTLLVAWAFTSKRDALQVEYKIKQLSRKQKLWLIENKISFHDLLAVLG